MAIINFTPRGFALWIGGYNVTAYTTEINLTRSRPELGKWISWSGSITLDEPANATEAGESFDDLEDNPARWLPGNHPVVLWIDNQRICTVRIADYRWDEVERRATVEVQDLLTLLNGQDPPVDYEGLEFAPGAGASVANVVSKLLDLAGLGGAIAGSPRGSFPVAPDHRGGGFVAAAAKILSERGQYLHLDKVENPAVVNFYGQTVASDALYYWGGLPGQTELEIFERERSPRWGYSVVEVRGTGRKFANCGGDENWEIEQMGSRGGREYISLREEFRVIFDTSSERLTQLTRYQPRIEAFPKRFFSQGGYGFDLERVAVIETRERYDSQGRLTRRTVTTDGMLGVFVPVPFGIGSESKPDGRSGTAGERWIDAIESVTTNYKEQPSGAVSGTFYSGLSPGPLREVDEVSEKTYALTRVTSLGGFSSAAEATAAFRARPWIEANEETNLANVTIRKMQATRKTEQWIEDRQKSSSLAVAGGGGIPTASGACCDRFEQSLYEFDRRSFRIGYAEDEGLLLVNTKTTPGQTPPAWQTRKPDAPVCDFPLEATANIPLPGEIGSNPLKGTRKAIVGFDTLNRQSEVNEFLDFTVRRLQGQGRNRQIVGPVRDWFINRPDPCGRVRVNREEFVVVGESLLIRPEEMSLGFVGEFAGTCPPVPAPATAERSDYDLDLEAGDVPIVEPIPPNIRINMPAVGAFSLLTVANPVTQIQMIDPVRFSLSNTPIPLTLINVAVPTFELIITEL